MKFLDQAKIYVRSGNGGAGSASFRREKFIEYGGPDGGDGGRGGDVVLECVDGLNTLIDYRYAQHFKGETGHHGMGAQRTGGKGKDVVLRLPRGTQVIATQRSSGSQSSLPRQPATQERSALQTCPARQPPSLTHPATQRPLVRSQ